MSSCLSFAISRSKPFSAAAWVKILETFLRWFVRFIIIALILFVFLSDRERGILNVKRLAQETIEEGIPRCPLRRCNLNRGAPPRLQRRRSFSSASSHRTRAWRQRDRDRILLWSERSA